MPNGIFTLKQQVDGLRQGAWTNQKTPFVNYLVVAGGGGGGQGGAGAGGLLAGSSGVTAGSQLWVTVGAGGTGTLDGNGTQGGNSVLLATSSGATTGTIVSLGGGLAGPGNGTSGGSGSGGDNSGAAGFPGGAGTSGQGNAGGTSVATSAGRTAAGGGGAGTVGFPNIGNSPGGNGGAGIASDISGTRTTYAGGGGGVSSSGTPGTGGVGGGGAGGTGSGSAGTANTGGGGGGGFLGSGYSGGNGGSGIVIISYPDVYAAAASTTGSPTVSTSGSGSILSSASVCLTYPNNAAFDFGASNFTIESWIYPTSVLEQYIYSKRASATFTPIQFGLTTSGGNNRVYFLGSTSGASWEINGSFSAGAINIPLNTWTHIALVRNGNVYTAYVNGVADLTATVSGSLMTNTSAISIGASVIDGSNAFRGNYTNVRVVKGTAVYTANFTPSTIPLAAISGTSLLMSTVSGSFTTDSSANSFTPTGVGAPAWNASSPFTVTGYKNRVYTWTSSGSITF